jgi:hypothetical protein
MANEVSEKSWPQLKPLKFTQPERKIDFHWPLEFFFGAFL